MSENKSFSKIKIIIPIVLVLLVISGFVFLYLRNDYEKKISVVSFDGTVNIIRDGSSKEAYPKMRIASKDRIVTGEKNSSIVLEIDNEKNAFIEENSDLSIDFSGNVNDSSTKIKLNKGAIFSELSGGLSEKSSYEIRTGNSLVSFNGGSVRVSCYESENRFYTRVSVFDGQAFSLAISEAGNTGENIITTKNGRETLIYTDRDTGLCGFAYFEKEKDSFAFDENSVPARKFDIASYPVGFQRYIAKRLNEGVRFSGLSPENNEIAKRASGNDSFDNMYVDSGYIALVLDAIGANDNVPVSDGNELLAENETDFEEINDSTEDANQINEPPSDSGTGGNTRPAGNTNRPANNRPAVSQTNQDTNGSGAAAAKPDQSNTNNSFSVSEIKDFDYKDADYYPGDRNEPEEVVSEPFYDPIYWVEITDETPLIH